MKDTYMGLPPSSPPDENSSDEDLPVATSEDIPLALVSRPSFQYHDQTAIYNANTDTSDDTPLAEQANSYHNGSTHGRVQRPSTSSAPTDLPRTPQQPKHHLDNKLSSDVSIYTPRTERKVVAARTQLRRQQTLSQVRLEAQADNAKQEALDRQRTLQADAHNQATREKEYNEILDLLQRNGHSLAAFLDYVFNPANKLDVDWRWSGFWKHETAVRQIFSYWRSPQYSTTARTLLHEIALGLVESMARKESEGITQSKILSKSAKVVDERFFLDYDTRAIGRQLRKMAPSAFRVFDAFATTTRQLKRGLSSEWTARKEVLKTSAVFSLLKAASSNNSYPQYVHGTYLMSTGAQRQHLSVATTLGLSVSYPSVIYQKASGHKDGLTAIRAPRAPGTLSQLSEACRTSARNVAKSGLFLTVYDNINMMIRVAEQVLGRKNAQENGTCATILPLHKADLKDMTVEEYTNSVMNAPPLSLDDILLSPSEHETHIASMKHTILRIIVDHGGAAFHERWQSNLDEGLPKTSRKIQPLVDSVGNTLPLRTPLHPLPTMEIDESSTVGNVDVIGAIDSELLLDQQITNYVQFVRIIAGDQLTIARQRSVLNIRSGHESGLHAWKHIVLMPGLFHAKIADCHGLLEAHFGKSTSGKRSPGSLSFHNTVLDRIPIVLSSLPPFRVTRDLIMISLYARVLHCLLLVSKKASLADYISSVSSWSTVEQHAEMIYAQFANADIVSKLRDQRALEEQAKKQKSAKKGTASNSTPSDSEHIPKGDMVFENAVLFLRDALITREFADAVKAGDSGRVVIVLKLWALMYRGSGRSKYAHEMLHVIYNLSHLLPPGLRDIILNNWLVNPSGKDNSFVEVDLLQEHLNFWIKKIYKADGNAHSWDWLAMVSPCIDILRQLAHKINGELGSRQGAKHSIPDLSRDIKRLMDSLHEHSVYVVQEGRVLDADDQPAPDIMTKGLSMLVSGSPPPLQEINNYYMDLRKRWRVKAVSSLLDFLQGPGIPEKGSEMESLEAAEEDGAPERQRPISGAQSDEASESEGESEEEVAGGDALDSPTLECIGEDDVALDMDVYVLENEDIDVDEELAADVEWR